MQKVFGSVIDGVDYAAAAPTTGTHVRGEIVFNSGAAYNLGWRCTVAGTPGTWEAFGGTYLTATYASAPAAIANGNALTRTVTVTGAALGDFAAVSFSASIQALVAGAVVDAADTVKVTLNNNTGGTINLGSVDMYVRVTRK